MRSEELLDIIGNARDRYVAEAMATREGVKARPRRLSRVMLIAATIALMLMLVGCAAVYVLHLQDMKVAQRDVTQQRDVFGNLMDPTELTEDILYPYAPSDSPMQQAAKEWYEFVSTYDPERELLTNYPEGVPENYQNIYHCYTQEMMDRLDEITDKYGLQLLEYQLIAQAYQKDILYDALAIENVTLESAQAEIQEHYGTFYNNGSFDSALFFTLTGEDAWPAECFAQMYYTVNDRFMPYYRHIVTETSQEWTYETADGTTVLLVMEEDGTGQIFAQVENAYIRIEVDPGNLSPNPYPRDENDLPTKEVLEQIADIFDYHVRPQPFDPAPVQEKLDVREAEQQEKMQQAASAYNTFPECQDYGAYLNTLNFVENQSYMLLDLNGDGVQDLFLRNGIMTTALTLRDGQVTQLFQWFGPAEPCEGGILLCTDAYYGIPGEGSYRRLVGDSLEYVEGLMYRDGTWRHGTADRDNGYTYPVSEEEAQAVRDKYKPVDAPLLSCAGFPMGDTTLGEMIAAEPKPNEEELRRLYAEHVRTSDQTYLEGVQYYTLRDITGDGEKDLLVSCDGETIQTMFSCYRGRVLRRLGMSYRLREDNVLESVYTHLSDVGGVPGGEVTVYQVKQFRDNKSYDLGDFTYVRDTDSWVNSREEPIPASAYHDLIDQHPLVELDWEHIEDLIG